MDQRKRVKKCFVLSIILSPLCIDNLMFTAVPRGTQTWQIRDVSSDNLSETKENVLTSKRRINLDQRRFVCDEFAASLLLEPGSSVARSTRATAALRPPSRNVAKHCGDAKHHICN